MFELLNPRCWKISVQPNNDHAQQCDPLGKQCIDPRDQAALRPLLWQTSWHATHQLLGTSPLEFTASSLLTRYGCGFSLQIPAPAIQWISARPRYEMLKPKIPSFWLRSSSLILHEVMPHLSLGFAGRSTPEWDSRRLPSPGCHCNTWHPTPSLLPPRWRNPWDTQAPRHPQKIVVYISAGAIKSLRCPLPIKPNYTLDSLLRFWAHPPVLTMFARNICQWDTAEAVQLSSGASSCIMRSVATHFLSKLWTACCSLDSHEACL